MPEVWIPPLLQRLTGGQKQVYVAGQTVRQVIDNLDQVFPGLKMELYDEEEDLVMPGIAVVVDGETSQLGLLEHVREDSEIHFLPALGGGAFTASAAPHPLYPNAVVYCSQNGYYAQCGVSQDGGGSGK